MSSSLKKLAIKGTAWTILGYGGGQSLRFAGNLVLTRLLLPEYFGLMALVNAVRQGIELFSDIGIAQNIIRSPHGDEEDFLNTAWSISVLRGIFLWVAFILLAWPVSQFYEEPLLFKILLVISFIAIERGLVSTRLYTLNRHMQLGKTTLLEFSTQFVAVITMIIVALIYPSVWSLVIGALVGQTFRMIASYLLFPGHKHKFMIQADAKKEIISFGRWIFLSSIVTFLAQQSDRIILGKLIPLEVLGVYSVAYIFSNIPQQVMRQMSFRVIFPVVSKQIEIPRSQLRNKLNRQRWKLHIILIIISIVLAGFGDVLINNLYDERYQQAAWMMPLLALGGWFSALFYIANPCLLALGKSVYSAQSRLFRLLAVTIGLMIGFRVAGIFGAIIVIALGDVPSYLAVQYGLYREGLGCLWQDMRSTLILIFVMGGVFMIRLGLGLGLPFDALFNL